MTTKALNKTYKTLQDISPTLPRIEASQVQVALNAEPSDVTWRGTGGPLTLYQVRHELLQRLQSTGGRPSLSGVSQRVKIPLNDLQWKELEAIASEVKTSDFSPSAGQIASVLLTLSLRSLRRD